MLSFHNYQPLLPSLFNARLCNAAVSMKEHSDQSVKLLNMW